MHVGRASLLGAEQIAFSEARLILLRTATFCTRPWLFDRLAPVKYLPSRAIVSSRNEGYHRLRLGLSVTTCDLEF